MIRFIRFFIVVSLALGAGYYLGSQRNNTVEKIISSVRTETATRVSGLEKEVRALRFKVNLTSAKDRIVETRDNLLERNFGSAEENLKSAEKDLQTAAGMTSPKMARTLDGIRKEIDPLIPRLHRSGSESSKRLTELQQKLEKILEELE